MAFTCTEAAMRELVVSKLRDLEGVDLVRAAQAVTGMRWRVSADGIYTCGDPSPKQAMRIILNEISSPIQSEDPDAAVSVDERLVRDAIEVVRAYIEDEPAKYSTIPWGENEVFEVINVSPDSDAPAFHTVMPKEFADLGVICDSEADAWFFIAQQLALIALEARNTLHPKMVVYGWYIEDAVGTFTGWGRMDGHRRWIEHPDAVEQFKKVFPGITVHTVYTIAEDLAYENRPQPTVKRVDDHVFTVEHNDGWQAVFPEDMSELSAVFETPEGAWAHIVQELVNREHNRVDVALETIEQFFESELRVPVPKTGDAVDKLHKLVADIKEILTKD